MSPSLALRYVVDVVSPMRGRRHLTGMTTNVDPIPGGRVSVRALCLAACAALTVSACSDDDDVATGTTLAPITSGATSPASTATPGAVATMTPPAAVTTAPPATTLPAVTSVPPQPTAPPGTEPPATDPAATDPGDECETPVGRDTFNDGYPNRMSGMVGSDIRTGAHPCFERVVIELAGPGDMPGVRVEYVDDPVHLSPSDETVDIDGDATLVISVAAWMPSMEGDGYAGPVDFSPTNVEHILQVRQVENFEGMSAWAIGLDTARDFEVTFLQSPARIVVDIAT
jgi:hypothetical protein